MLRLKRRQDTTYSRRRNLEECLHSTVALGETAIRQAVDNLWQQNNPSRLTAHSDYFPLARPSNRPNNNILLGQGFRVFEVFKMQQSPGQAD
jgi:hypothetical protein